MSTSQDRIIIVAQEGRPDSMVGLRLLFASLARFSPDLPVHAYVPAEAVDEVQKSVSQIHSKSSVVAFDTEVGWGCKPTVMLHALDQLDDPTQRVLWIDADILACDQVERLLDVPPETLIVAEETTHHENTQVEVRQAALGLEPGKTRVTTISSCVVGVTAAHRPILEAWERCVQTDLFRFMQSLPWSKRLIPGDQEILEAVVCSGKFRETPLHVLRNFNEMVQGTYVSKPPLDGQARYQNPPMFIHATGDLKPWRTTGTRIAKEMFPFFDHSLPYLEQLEPAEREAFNSTCFTARTWKRLMGSEGGFRSYLAFRRLHRRLRHG